MDFCWYDASNFIYVMQLEEQISRNERITSPKGNGKPAGAGQTQHSVAPRRKHASLQGRAGYRWVVETEISTLTAPATTHSISHTLAGMVFLPISPTSRETRVCVSHSPFTSDL